MISCRVLGLVLVLSAGRAIAAPPPEAKVHFQAGSDYYAAGKYDDAIREFETAYELSHYPEMLLNLARAHTKAGHDEQAVSFLERYLAEKPDADDAASVKFEIAARKKALEEARAAKSATGEAEQAKRLADEERKRSAATVEAAQRSERKVKVRISGIAILAVGIAALATGAVMGVLAMRDAEQVSAMGGGRDFRGEPLATQNAGQRDEKVAIGLFIGGGALAAAGAGLVGWSIVLGRSEARVSLAPTVGGLVAQGSF